MVNVQAPASICLLGAGKVVVSELDLLVLGAPLLVGLMDLKATMAIQDQFQAPEAACGAVAGGGGRRAAGGGVGGIGCRTKRSDR